ncbi:hypothetical protein DL768_004112 [Monosporascus sp. mg162]|nr:hypothetical protein DL768_004112 [Monosporascus sp. mg162]
MATEVSSSTSSSKLRNGASIGGHALTTSSGSEEAHWSAQYLPVLSSLLENAGRYSPEERASHLRFIEDHVIPNVGPRPASLDVVYVVSHFGSSTFEARINLNDKGKPCVRFTFEPHCPLANSAAATVPPTQGYPYKQVLGIAGAVRADPRQFSELAAEFFLSSEQEYYIALDLNGGQRQMKVYFYPLLKQMTTGMNSDEATFSVLNRFDPGFAAPLKAMCDFRATCPEPLAIQMIGIDCVAPEAGAGVKLYTRAESNAWDNIRHHVTLGGRRSDETTLRGLEILAGIWNLLLDEPGVTVDSSASKPVNDPTNVWHTSIIYSWGGAARQGPAQCQSSG